MKAKTFFTLIIGIAIGVAAVKFFGENNNSQICDGGCDCNKDTNETKEEN